MEVESGRKIDRPQLHKALSRCNLAGATLIIARLDRLSRNARFLLELQEAGVSFKACDAPYADSFTVGIMALVAQKEAESISTRTREALAQIKSGKKTTKTGKTKLGNPNGAEAFRRAGKGNEAAVKAVKAKAEAQAAKLRNELQEIIDSGVNTLASIADKLNERHIRTPSDKQWHPNSVRRLLHRLKLTFRVHKDRADFAISQALAGSQLINPTVKKDSNGDFVNVTIMGDTVPKGTSSAAQTQSTQQEKDSDND